MSKPKKPRTAGVATSTSITPSRISKSLRIAAPPSRSRLLRPKYSAGLAWPCSSQRGESGGMESVWEWAGHAKRLASQAPASHKRKKRKLLCRFVIYGAPFFVRDFHVLTQTGFSKDEFDEHCARLIKRCREIRVV